MLLVITAMIISSDNSIVFEIVLLQTIKVGMIRTALLAKNLGTTEESDMT